MLENIHSETCSLLIDTYIKVPAQSATGCHRHYRRDNDSDNVDGDNEDSAVMDDMDDEAGWHARAGNAGDKADVDVGGADGVAGVGDGDGADLGTRHSGLSGDNWPGEWCFHHPAFQVRVRPLWLLTRVDCLLPATSTGEQHCQHRL
jgi:hypothetical protein